MTRKDYELIAAALQRSRHSALRLQSKGSCRDMTDGVELTIAAVADALKDSNPRFDRDRFIAATI